MSEPKPQWTPRPVIVDGPQPCSALEAALKKINEQSKYVHLSPAEVKALREHHDVLEKKAHDGKAMKRRYEVKIANLEYVPVRWK